MVAEFSKNSNDSSNVCTHLIAKTLAKVAGTENLDAINNLLQMDPKLRRQYHDDITITVVFFNTDNLASNSISRVWKQETNFTQPSISIPITVGSCGQSPGQSVNNSPVNDEVGGSVRAAPPNCLPQVTQVRVS